MEKGVGCFPGLVSDEDTSLDVLSFCPCFPLFADAVVAGGVVAGEAPAQHAVARDGTLVGRVFSVGSPRGASFRLWLLRSDADA